MVMVMVVMVMVMMIVVCILVESHDLPKPHDLLMPGNYNGNEVGRPSNII